MRARAPDRSGVVERDGVRLAYEVFGAGAPTVVLLPTWSIIHSRFWKAQVPYLARHFRVVTFDGRGSGRSDRPSGADAYVDDEFVRDIGAVLDATGTGDAVLVALSAGARWAVRFAADHPDRTLGMVCLGPSVPLVPPLPERALHDFDDRLDTTEGWASYNRHNWLEGDYGAFLRFFFGRAFTEAHSTKQIEDCVGWGLEIDPVTLVDTQHGFRRSDPAAFRSACGRVRCPVLVVHGTEDAVTPHAGGAALAELTGGTLVSIEGGGHCPQSRDPVEVNHLVKGFVDRVRPPGPTRVRRTRALRRERRVLYLSSPIGLGHARRDLAIASELRRRHPDVAVDWLAQPPVTGALRAAGESVHPASAWLASESAHVEDECGEHDLHAFSAIRRMDEILVANFMVFADVVADGDYDLVIGDEAWDVDHHLHENPHLKRFSFAWITDFVGWLPMPDGGEHEAALTADYNAEMIAHRSRLARVRDRSIFVGDPDDVVTTPFGPGLPSIREWTEREFDFAGYVTGFPPVPASARADLRAHLGYRDDERVCVVTVGGSGVGAPLLRRVLEAAPAARARIDGLRVEVVAGPRIDPSTLPPTPGVTVHRYVPDLHRHLAACDIAVVQGGLTTCMELTANRRPFVFVPLRHHFEQQLHVRHRLERYGAGRHLAYEDLDPDSLADALADEIDRQVAYRPVDADGARRAGAMLAELL